MIGLISIAGITYGANAREGVEAAAEALELESTIRDADEGHMAKLTAEGGQLRLKQGERSLTMTTSAINVDYLWLRDADSGKLLSASQNKKRSAAPELVKTLNVGTRVVPLVHCLDEPATVWRGPVFTVA